MKTVNCIFLLFIFEAILFGIAFYGTKRDIMAPSVIFCISLITGTFVAILNLGKWDALGDYGLSSCLILSSGILVVVLVEQLVIRVRGRREIRCVRIRSEHAEETFHAFDVQGWKILFLLVFNLSMTLWYLLEIYHIVLAAGWDGNDFIDTYRNIMIDQKGEGSSAGTSLFLNQMLKIVDASAYISLYCIICNILAGKAKTWKNIGLGVVCVSPLVQHLLVGGRSEILHLLVTALIYYYILWHKKFGWNKSLVKKYIVVGLRICVVSIPVFYLLLVAMGRGRSGHAGVNMLQHASIYIGSGVALFDQYIKAPVAGPAYFGEETLIGFNFTLQRLGLTSNKVTERFLETRSLTKDRSLRSNVYSFFRRPYHDFGFVGMLFFTAVVAFLFSWIYNKKIKDKSQSKSFDYWVLIYGYLYYWLFFALVEQKGLEYISIGTVLILIAILVGFFLMVRVKVSVNHRSM